MNDSKRAKPESWSLAGLRQLIREPSTDDGLVHLDPALVLLLVKVVEAARAALDHLDEGRLDLVAAIHVNRMARRLEPFVAPPKQFPPTKDAATVSAAVVIEIHPGSAVELPLEKARWQVTNFTDEQVDSFVAVLNEIKAAGKRDHEPSIARSNPAPGDAIRARPGSWSLAGLRQLIRERSTDDGLVHLDPALVLLLVEVVETSRAAL